MEKNSIYNIPIVALKNKEHHFEYKIDGEFFKYFDNKTINDCDIEVKVSLEKRDSVFVLLFYIDGKIKLACDRCLDIYSQEIFGDYKLIIQLDGEINQDNDNDDDIILIARNSDYLDVSKPIYDYILLSIPIQRTHSNKGDCNRDILEHFTNSKQEIKDIDPRWDALKKIKNK